MKLITTDVLVIGGGTSGSAAGIQSARLGVKTIIVEETPWLGGMITSAGVSAFDGNKYALGGGIFGELRKMIEEHYGGADKTFTGWISLTCFEPKIGKQFLHELAEKEKELTIYFETKLISVIRENNKILGAVFQNKNGEEFTVKANVTIEATEFGDVLKLGNVPYRLGRDSKSDTGEPDAPEKPDFEIQDMTYCAILKKYEVKAPQVPQPKNYNPELFINSTEVHSNTTDEKYLNHKLHSWESFISYAALPNDKYLLNWPFRSNDYYINDEIYEKPETRIEHYKKAKELTLAYVHYIQTKLGHPEWGLATDEFSTEDNLPFIPYVRESRRVKGKYLMVERDVIPIENSFRPPLHKDSIAVGDYFLDHHHSTFFKEPEERLVEPLPSNAPFQIPFNTLLPENIDGLIVAEKSISVSHIVNGCSRLQPVVMLIGQAAGAAAALSVINNSETKENNIKGLQKILIKSGCQLFPYKDLWNTHSAFEAAQYLALEGLFVDNENFEFLPNEKISNSELEKVKILFNDKVDTNTLINKTRSEVYISIWNKLSN